MDDVKRYLPAFLTANVCALLYALFAFDWGPWGQLAAQIVVVIPPIYVAYRSGLMDPPQKSR